MKSLRSSIVWSIGALGAIILPVFNISVICISVLGVFVPSAICQEVGPQDVEVSTPVYHAESGSVDYPLGTYHYTVSWQGIPAAEASISLEQDGLRYRVSTTAKTYSGVDIFYKLRYRAEGILSAVDFLPQKTSISQQENSRFKETEINYLNNGDINTVRSQIGKETFSLTFDPNNFTLDPFSAGFIARGLEWEVGKTAVFDTFNGKTRYLIELTALDKKTMTINGEDREVWLISPRVKKLTSTKADKKLRSAVIYMTADAKREIIKIESEVFIGTVTTKLDEFMPSTAPVQGATLAQNVTPIKWVF